MQNFDKKDKETVLGYDSRLNAHLTATKQAKEYANIPNPEESKGFVEVLAIDQFRKAVNAAYSTHIARIFHVLDKQISKPFTISQNKLKPL